VFCEGGVVAKKRKRKPVARARSREERERVIAIAMRIVAGQAQQGLLDMNNEDAVEEATRAAVKLAFEAYRAAEEYVFGA
jgi:hypothetical protein